MFKLRKLHEPFGTPDVPQYETSYSEGLIPVVNGVCDVRLPETRDRLVKLGYEEVTDEPGPDGSNVNGSNLGGPAQRRSIRKKSSRKKKSRR
jgi:hypothetical protein